MSDYLVHFAVANAMAVALLAVVALLLASIWTNPRFVHAMWLVVLLKFLMPPVVTLEVGWVSWLDSAHSQSFAGHTAPLAERAFETDDRVQTVSAGQGTVTGIAGPDQIDKPPMSDDSSPPNDDPVATLANSVEQPIVPSSTNANAGAWNWKVRLLLVWGVGSMFCASVTAIRVRRFQSLIAHLPVAGPLVVADVDCIARQFSLRRVPEVRVAAANVTPFVAAVGRPVLVLPLAIESWAQGQREAVIAHELAHLRRRDHFVCWLSSIVRHVFWWHPIAYLASIQVHRAAEMCCDAMVLTQLRDQSNRDIEADYLAAMLNVIGFSKQSDGVPAIGSLAFGEGRFLFRRFQMILAKPVCYAIPLKHRAIMLSLVALLPMSIAATTAPQELAASDDASVADHSKATISDSVEKASRVDDSPMPEKLEELSRTAEEVHAAKLLDSAIAETTRRIEAIKSTSAQRVAAKRKCDSMLTEFAAGKVTMDLLLDAQRHLAEAESQYFQAALGTGKSATTDAVRARLHLELESLRYARNSALTAWQLEYAFLSTGNRRESAHNLAQVKEQYFLFRGHMESKQAELARVTSQSRRTH